MTTCPSLPGVARKRSACGPSSRGHQELEAAAPSQPRHGDGVEYRKRVQAGRGGDQRSAVGHDECDGVAYVRAFWFDHAVLRRLSDELLCALGEAVIDGRPQVCLQP